MPRGCLIAVLLTLFIAGSVVKGNDSYRHYALRSPTTEQHLLIDWVRHFSVDQIKARMLAWKVGETSSTNAHTHKLIPSSRLPSLPAPPPA